MKEALIGFILFSVLAWGCESKEEVEETVTFDGPLIELDSVQMLYSDSAVVKVQLNASKQLEYLNGNQDYPAGIYIEFYENDGSVSATLRADKAFFLKAENLYTGVGNVVIEGRKDKTWVYTDTLHWSPPTERIFTSDSVMITDPQDTLRGVGLEANQTFTSYTILNPIGTTVLSDEKDSIDE